MASVIPELTRLEPPFPPFAFNNRLPGLHPDQADLESRGQALGEWYGAQGDFDDVASLQTWVQCHERSLRPGVGHLLG